MTLRDALALVWDALALMWDALGPMLYNSFVRNLQIFVMTYSAYSWQTLYKAGKACQGQAL